MPDGQPWQEYSVLTPDIEQRLQVLQPEAATHLTRINQLARDSTDRDLLDLCRDYLLALLANRDWKPPQPPTEREAAFLAFTEQFATAVSGMEDAQVEALLRFAEPDEVYNFVNSLYVTDMSTRLQLVLKEVL